MSRREVILEITLWIGFLIVAYTATQIIDIVNDHNACERCQSGNVGPV